MMKSPPESASFTRTRVIASSFLAAELKPMYFQQFTLCEVVNKGKKTDRVSSSLGPTEYASN
jgi:hypothetical protein